MKKNLSILIFTIGLIACKKDKSSNKSTTSTTPTTLLSGSFFYEHTVTNLFGVHTTKFKLSHGFYSPDVSSPVGVTPIDVGIVYANGVKLKKTSSSQGINYEVDTTVVLFPITYSITGANDFTTTTFVDNGSNSPAFTNYSVIPDTVKKSSGLSITLNNTSNISLTYLTINGVEFTSFGNSFNLTPAQLASVNSSTNPSTYIKVECMNQNNSNGTGFQTLNFGGKNYLHAVSFSYIKYGVVVIN